MFSEELINRRRCLNQQEKSNVKMWYYSLPCLPHKSRNKYIKGVCDCGTLLHRTARPPAWSRRQSGLEGDNVLKLRCTAQPAWTSSLGGEASFPWLLDGDAEAQFVTTETWDKSNGHVMHVTTFTTSQRWASLTRRKQENTEVTQTGTNPRVTNDVPH